MNQALAYDQYPPIHTLLERTLLHNTGLLANITLNDFQSCLHLNVSLCQAWFEKSDLPRRKEFSPTTEYALDHTQSENEHQYHSKKRQCYVVIREIFESFAESSEYQLLALQPQPTPSIPWLPGDTPGMTMHLAQQLYMLPQPTLLTGMGLVRASTHQLQRGGEGVRASSACVWLAQK